MKYLKTFEKHSDFDINSIYISKYDDLSSIKKYIKNGGDINIQDSYGETLLIKAAHCHNIDLINLLIKSGADLNIQDNDGETALIKASRSESVRTMCKLIDAGADWNIKRNYDYIKRSRNSAYRKRVKYFTDIDFFEMLAPRYQKIIKEKYPEKYEEYLAKKNAEKYNL